MARLREHRGASADAEAFARRCHAAEMTDLKALTRGLVAQMERDLGTSLDWVAVDHWNTDNPHVHLLVRGIAGVPISSSPAITSAAACVYGLRNWFQSNTDPSRNTRCALR
jgi:hypothetical protein